MGFFMNIPFDKASQNPGSSLDLHSSKARDAILFRLDAGNLRELPSQFLQLFQYRRQQMKDKELRSLKIHVALDFAKYRLSKGKSISRYQGAIEKLWSTVSLLSS